MLSLVIAEVLTFGLWWAFTKWGIKGFETKPPKDPPGKKPPKKAPKNWADTWNAIYSGGDDHLFARRIYGALEVALFIVAVWTGRWEIIVGWLAFKLATKWAMWSHILKVPEAIDGVEEADYLRWRHAWGTHRVYSFLNGTLLNFWCAFIAVALAGLLP